MAIKTILAPALEGGESALEAAFGFAKSHQAHVEVLHVSADPKESIAYLGEGMTGAMVEQVLASVERDNAAREAKARAAFGDLVKRHGAAVADKAGQAIGLTACFKSMVGRDDAVIPERGRLFDVLVVPRPGPDGASQTRVAVEAALLGSGRAVLLVPPGVMKPIGKVVAVAWNGSLEAARAIRLGGVVMRGAERVFVMSATEKGRRSRAEDLVDALAWHGRKAEAVTLDAGKKRVGHALLERAAQEGADLLIMGAYTHSRFRELVFGGATSDALDGATMPVVMVH